MEIILEGKDRALNGFEYIKRVIDLYFDDKYIKKIDHTPRNLTEPITVVVGNMSEFFKDQDDENYNVIMFKDVNMFDVNIYLTSELVVSDYQSTLLTCRFQIHIVYHDILDLKFSMRYNKNTPERDYRINGHSVSDVDVKDKLMEKINISKEISNNYALLKRIERSSSMHNLTKLYLLFKKHIKEVEKHIGDNFDTKYYEELVSILHRYTDSYNFNKKNDSYKCINIKGIKFYRNAVIIKNEHVLSYSFPMNYSTFQFQDYSERDFPLFNILKVFVEYAGGVDILNATGLKQKLMQ